MGSFIQTNLGGGIKGVQKELLGSMDGGNERSVSRKQLVKAFGNLNNNGLGSSPALYNKNVLGPFRTSINGGDVVTLSQGATNSKYGFEANLVNGNNLSRLNINSDSVNRKGNASYSGNPKYVYDGSDYTRFKKLNAINKTYNDNSYGGAQNNQTQSSLKKVRS